MIASDDCVIWLGFDQLQPARSTVGTDIFCGWQSLMAFTPGLPLRSACIGWKSEPVP